MTSSSFFSSVPLCVDFRNGSLGAFVVLALFCFGNSKPKCQEHNAGRSGKHDSKSFSKMKSVVGKKQSTRLRLAAPRTKPCDLPLGNFV